MGLGVTCWGSDPINRYLTTGDSPHFVHQEYVFCWTVSKQNEANSELVVSWVVFDLLGKPLTL